MRLAVGGIAHETNTFSPLRTGLAEFVVARGADVLERGIVAPVAGVEWVPTLCAWATPHGLVLREAYEALRSELLSRLSEAMPVDGVLLALHGAMEVEGIGDGESDLTQAVRELVGPSVPIAASLDLHANIAPAFAQAASVITAQRTAPHVDDGEVRDRVAAHLVRCVREGLQPTNVLVKLPLLLPGEYAVTEREPARSLYARLGEIESRPGVMDASLAIGCAWTDSPYTSVSVVAVAESGVEPAERAARELAAETWARRAEFGPESEMLPLAEAVAAAMADPNGPIVISDSGDNVTAGAAGDIPLAVGELLRAGAQRAIVCPLADPEAVRICSEAGQGASVTVGLGGKLDRRVSQPLQVTGVVRRATEGLAVLEVGSVLVVITSGRRGAYRMDTYAEAGIDPADYHIVVAKQGYLSGELRRIARRSIWATTPGATSLDLEHLPYERLCRPIYPLDPETEWNG